MLLSIRWSDRECLPFRASFSRYQQAADRASAKRYILKSFPARICAEVAYKLT